MRTMMLAAALTVCAMACDPLGLDGDQGPAEDRTGYPEGPYGKAKGQTLDNLGFVAEDGSAFTLQQVYADGDNRMLLLNTGAGWCSACSEEQPELEALHQSYRERGLQIVVAIFEDASYQPADAEDAKRWRQQNQLSFSVVADPDFVLGGYYNRDLTPMNMLVEVDTMRISYLTTGWDPSAVEALLEAKL